ncbi:MAG: hypothetical protein IIB71_09210 [Proteobacteria bacterium]|nr:hypothetical protein [Pseudomonadota bacterium]
MGVNASPRLLHHLLAVLLSLVLLDAKASEFVTIPTFGEQMRELVQAHDRGEITFEELMVLRDTLSKQHAGGSTGHSQAEKLLMKFRISIKKPVAEIPTSTPEADHPPYPATTPLDKEPTSVMPAESTPTSRKPVLNCSGIRKFMLRCLRRPYPFERND